MDMQRTESPTITGHCPLTDLLKDSLLRAHARRKSFSFFHHYLSLFLLFYTIQLTASEIDRVIDE